MHIIKSSGCTKFIEPFGGSGTVGMNLFKNSLLMDNNFSEYHYNDIDTNIVKLIQLLVTDDSFVQDILSIDRQYENTDSNYYFLKASYNSMVDKLSKQSLALLYILHCRSFNNMFRFNKKGEFNLPYGKRNNINSIMNNLDEIKSSLANVKLNFSNIDFREVLNDIKTTDFVFVDPPYDFTSATYNDGWTIEDSKHLLNRLNELNSMSIKWMLTTTVENRGKTNDLMLEFSKRFNSIEIGRNIGFGNSSRFKSKEQTIELAIYNY